MASIPSVRRTIVRGWRNVSLTGPSDADLAAELRNLCMPPPVQLGIPMGRISHHKVTKIQGILAYLEEKAPRADNKSPQWTPRIFAILQAIGGSHLMNGFIEQGLSDFFLPFNQQTLPSFVSSTGLGYDIRQAFLDTQDYYLTDAKDIEIESLKHVHIDNGNAYFTSRKHLGQGGFGAVDLVTSLLSFKHYARKRVVRGRDSESNRSAQKSMVQELKHLKKLKHHHLVKIVGSYTDREYIAYLMEPIAKCTMEQFLKGSKPPPEAHRDCLRRWYGCLAGAVQYLHDNKIRHRDLTCRNVLITRDDDVRISDFGTAYNWSDRLSSNTRHLSTHVSKDYMSPEVARHDERGTSSDMWSLGVIFLRMTTRLLGYRLDDLQHRISRAARETNVQPYVYANMPVVTKWLESLSSSNTTTTHDNEPIVWVRNLLQEMPSNRQHARSLMKDILESPSFDLFCCFRCKDDFRDGGFAYDMNMPRQHSVDSYHEMMDSVAAVFDGPETPKLPEKKSASIEQWLSGGTSSENDALFGGLVQEPTQVEDEYESLGVLGSGHSLHDPFDQRAAGSLLAPSQWFDWRTDHLQRLENVPQTEGDDRESGFFSAASDVQSSEDIDGAQGTSGHAPNTPAAPIDFRDSGLGFNEYDSDSSLADDGRLFDEVSDRPDSGSSDDEDAEGLSQDLHTVGGRMPRILEDDEELSDTPTSPEELYDSKVPVGDTRFIEVDDESESESECSEDAMTPDSGEAESHSTSPPAHVTTGLAVQPLDILLPTSDKARTPTDSAGHKKSYKIQPDSTNKETNQKPTISLNPSTPTPGDPPGRQKSKKTTDCSIRVTSPEPLKAITDHRTNTNTLPASTDSSHAASSEAKSLRDAVLDDGSEHRDHTQKASSIKGLGRQSSAKPEARQPAKKAKKVQISLPETSEEVLPDDPITIKDDPPRAKDENQEKPASLSARNIKILNTAHAKKAPTAVPHQLIPQIDPKGFLQQAWDMASNAPTSVMSLSTKKRLASFLSPLIFSDNPRGGGILLDVCKQGNSRQLRYLLDRGCNPGTVHKPRPRALLAAVSGGTDGHRKCVRQLIRFDANVNVRAKKSRKTPLHIAVAHDNFVGYAKLVRLLVDAGADVNARDANKDHPLAALFQDGNDSLPLATHRRQALAILLKADAEVNFALLGTKDTPLHLAVRRKDAYAVAMLLYKDAAVRAKNSSGATPLQITANQFRGGDLAPEHAQVLEWLLRHGRDMVDEAAGAAGRTPLHHAVAAGNAGAVSILLEHGASPLIRDSSQRTATELAMQSTAGNIKLSQSAKTKKSPGKEEPAFRIQDHVDIFTLLAAATPSAPIASPPESKDAKTKNEDMQDGAWPVSDGRCVLDIACDAGSGSSLRLLRRLLAAKLPVDTVFKGLPLLHHATQRVNVPAVQLLLKKGAFVDLEKHTGRDVPNTVSAALDMKTTKGNQLAQLLVKEGAFHSDEAKAIAVARVRIAGL